MREIGRKVAGVVMAVALMVMPMVPVVLGAGVAWADDPGGTHVDTSILPDDWANASDGEGIKKVLGLVLNILVYGLGVLATLGVIIAGIMYMTARDNEQQVAKAKTRLIEIVIGLIAWALMYTVMNWLIPGGWSGLM